MPTNKWTTDKSGFYEAVKADEYAEYDLGDGYTLITDWEGDGVFNPYVVPHHKDKGGNEELVAEKLDEIMYVDEVEWDDSNELYYPYGVSIPN